MPDYATVGYYECSTCGAEYDNVKDMGRHIARFCMGSYTYKTKQMQTGSHMETQYKTVIKYKTETYKKEAGYYKCSCDVRK